MVVLEVTLPSGYVAESDTLLNVSNSFNVKKVETKNGNTIFVVYFDSFEAHKKICPVFDAFRAHQVEKQKPVPITIYDYYDSSKLNPVRQVCSREFQIHLILLFHLEISVSLLGDRATVFYEAPLSNTI